MVTKRILTTLIAALWMTTAAHTGLHADEPDTAAQWTIEIVPAAKVPADGSVVVRQVSDDPDSGTITTADYNRIYNAVPFRRAEYNANPSYRHDSAMEILTGNARHQTVVVHDGDADDDMASSRQRAAIPYRYNNSRWGLQYFYYFPYWNYRGLY